MFLLLLALLLLLRLFYIQVIQGERLARLAAAQRTQTIDLSALRGEIVDRNGKELAVSVEAVSVYATPKDARDFDPRRTAEALSPILNEPVQGLLARLKGNRFRWLKRQAPISARPRIAALRLPGVGMVSEMRRVYPKGQLAATLIGFVGVDNQGLAGIEHAFDDVLRGPRQKLRVEVDAYGREILREGAQGQTEAYLSDGTQVVLTIDENLQHICDRALAQAINESGALRGAVIMMEPQTGNLLAFSTLPTYDPNQFGRYDWNRIKNWAVTDVYEPGSTMKIFTIAAAIAAQRINENEEFDCPRAIKVDGRIVSDHDSPASGRVLTPFEIMEVSSNVGTTAIAFRLRAREHRDYLASMGFGSRTGSGISGESAALLPALPWRRITQATISYGHGLSVTPLQILSAASAIGNGGLRMTPRLIDRIVDSKGRVLREFPLKPEKQLMSVGTANTVMAMLERVVQIGTGREAQVPGYRIAGKTGTAQRVREDGRGYSDDVIASFVGFFPVEDPRFVMLTLLDSPRKVHWASSNAAPLFGRIAADTLHHLSIQPTAPVQPRPVKKASPGA